MKMYFSDLLQQEISNIVGIEMLCSPNVTEEIPGGVDSLFCLGTCDNCGRRPLLCASLWYIYIAISQSTIHMNKVSMWNIP